MRIKISRVLGAAAALGLAIWTALEHQRRVSLGQEHQALEQRLEEMTQLVASNERLSNLLAQAKSPRSLTEEESRELLRLRGQVGALRQQSRELETAREENRQARATLENRLASKSAAPGTTATADYWPQDSWAFKGYATPDAALQSSLWAANNGDLKALLASATGEMQKSIAEDLKGKSEAEASIKAMDEVMGIKSIRVVNRELRSDGTVVITAELEGPTQNRTEKLVMQKIDEEWKLSGSSN
jgi:hypothetical protein